MASKGVGSSLVVGQGRSDPAGTMRAVLPLVSLLLLACGSSGSSGVQPGSGGAGNFLGGVGGSGASTGGGNGEGGSSQVEALPAATGMAIGQVAVYQGVKIPLYADGADVTKLNAPIVQGREARVRVFFAPKDDWSAHVLVVRLTTENGAGEQKVYEIKGQPKGAATDEDLKSSANFTLPGEVLDGSLSLRVELLDAEPQGDGDTSGSAWPGEGFHALGEKNPNGPLHLKVIPITYGADKSNRQPKLDDDTLEGIRQGFRQQYPIPDLDLEVGDALTWTQTVSPNGTGWQQLLNKIVSLRGKDSSPNVYYFGLFMPAASVATFCGGGCVAGLTYITQDTSDVSTRASIGLAYDDTRIETMLHETGHAHRRTHAPCAPGGQIDQIDPKFPYDGGSIGVWGYDLVNRSLRSPTKYTDFMGYCSQTWVSDYTYSALFTRIQQLNQAASAYIYNARPTSWRQAFLDVGGELRWGDLVVRTTPPAGETIDVTVGSGLRAHHVQASFYGLSHLPGGMLLLPADTSLEGEIRAGEHGTFAVR